MYKDNYFEVEPGIQIHYYDEGKGQPIVFVPGWSFPASVFSHQIDYFSKKGYRCIAVNPRSQGKSTIAACGNTYNQQGTDLGKLIAHLGLKDIILAGWSFGALAAWAYCEQYGLSNLRASITMDNSPRSISDDEKEYRAGTLDGLRNDHWNNLCSAEAFRKFMGAFADGLLYEGKLDPVYRQQLIDEACQMPYEVADHLYMDGWLADKRKIVHQIDETKPSLLIVANYRKDTGVPYMKANYPHTEVHAFGMHMMFHEYPDRFNGVMEEFLQKIK